MDRIVVTGATGVLGRHLLPRLKGKIVPLAKHNHEGVHQVDLRKDLRDVVADADVIVHCATGAANHKAVDLAGLRNLVEAAPGARFVYPSIVGVDRIPFSYYTTKLACEKFLQKSGVEHAIIRFTQFHEFAERLAAMPVTVIPRGARIQGLAAQEAAARLAELVNDAELGHVGDMGGPEVYDLATAVKEHKRFILQPKLGKMGAAFRAGHNLCPHGAKGRITRAEWRT